MRRPHVLLGTRMALWTILTTLFIMMVGAIVAILSSDDGYPTVMVLFAIACAAFIESMMITHLRTLTVRFWDGSHSDPQPHADTTHR